MATGDVSASILILNAKGGAVFDGVDDYIDTSLTSNGDFLNGFTISAWIKPNSAGEGNTGRIIDKSINSIQTKGFAFYIEIDNRTVFTITGGAACRSAINSVITGDGKWYHVLVTINSSANAQTYVNNVISGSAQVLNALNGITTGNALRIGNRAIGTDFTFNGAISDVKIWNRTLTTAEITKDYNNQLVSEGLVHRWKLYPNSNDEITGESSTESGNRLVIQDSVLADRIKSTRVSGAETYLFEDALLGRVIFAHIEEGASA